MGLGGARRQSRKNAGFSVCARTGPSLRDLVILPTVPSAEQLAGKVVEGARSTPQALKRGHIFNDLTARLKSSPSQKPVRVRVFPQVVKRWAKLARPSGAVFSSF